MTHASGADTTGETGAPRSQGLVFDPGPAALGGWRWILAATLVAAAFRVIGHAQQSFWADEVESMKLLCQPGADVWYVLSHNFHGPLHKALLVAWCAVFGVSDAAARLLSAAIGTASIPILYAAGRRWVGENGARAAAFLCAVNPFHVWYSMEVRGYILLMAMGILGMWAFSHELETRSRRSWLLLVLANLGAGLSSFGGLFLIPTQGLLALGVFRRARYPLRRFVLAQLLVLAALSNYFLEFGTTVDPSTIVGIGEVTDAERLRGDHTFSPLAPAHSIYAYSAGLTIGPSVNEMHRSLTLETFRPHIPVMAVVGIVFGALGLIGLRMIARRRDLAVLLVSWLAMPIVCASLLAILNVKVYNVRYPSVGFMAWMLILGAGLAGLRRRGLALALGVAALGLGGLARVNQATQTRFWRPDARAAAELIEREARPNDHILVYTIIEPFVHYYSWVGGGAIPVETIYRWHFEAPDRLEKSLRAHGVGDGRLWVVRYRSWYIDGPELYKRTLDRRLPRLGSWVFPELPVDLYEQVSAETWSAVVSEADTDQSPRDIPR